MPLPIVTDSLDAIPEAARGAFVKGNDGKFRLDVEIEDTTGLKAKNADLVTKNKQLAARAAVIGDRSPEEVQADLDFAKEQREKRAKEEGRFEELTALQKTELAKRDAVIFDLVAKQAADEAIVAAGGKVKKLRGEVLKHIKVMAVAGVPTAVVVDAAGKQRIKDGQGTPVTVADVVEEIKADDDYANDFAASGATGSGARNDGGARGTTGTVVIPKDASPQEYRRMKADAEKRGVPYVIGA